MWPLTGERRPATRQFDNDDPKTQENLKSTQTFRAHRLIALDKIGANDNDDDLHSKTRK